MSKSDGKELIPTQLLFHAFDRVKENHGSPGVDGITVEVYEKTLKENLAHLQQQMASGSYQPSGVKGVEIPKKSGGVRLLGIPTVNDRVAQTVACLVLEPFLEEIFLDDSFAYRHNRSALDAVRQTLERCRTYDWVLVFDIKGLFDNLNHEILMRLVSRHTQRPWLLKYIVLWLRAPLYMSDGTVRPRSAGTPQGGAISPVLANLYMHYCFDLWMRDTRPNQKWTRYADDALIHCRTREEAEQTMAALKARLGMYQLEISPEKSKIAYCADRTRKAPFKDTTFTYLGYTFCAGTDSGPGDRKGDFRAYLDAGSVKNMAASLKEWKHKAIKKKLSVDERKEIASRIRGWRSYSQIDTSTPFRNLLQEADEFLACLSKEQTGAEAKHTERGRT